MFGAMEEIAWDRDDMRDILARDRRYHSRAYEFLQYVIDRLAAAKGEHAHLNATELTDGFIDIALDYFGPLAFAVVDGWGVHEGADLGELMRNLVESGRAGKDEGDRYEDFADGPDLADALKSPYSS